MLARAAKGGRRGVSRWQGKARRGDQGRNRKGRRRWVLRWLGCGKRTKERVMVNSRLGYLGGILILFFYFFPLICKTRIYLFILFFYSFLLGDIKIWEELDLGFCGG